MTRPDLLIPSLQAAVPLWADQLRALDDDTRAELMRRWQDAAWEPLAHMSDVGMMGGGTKGEAAAWFNHLARAIAALSFCPGGVTVFGVHWCQNHSGCSEYLIAQRQDIFDCDGHLPTAFARAEAREQAVAGRAKS